MTVTITWDDGNKTVLTGVSREDAAIIEDAYLARKGVVKVERS